MIFCPTFRQAILESRETVPTSPRQILTPSRHPPSSDFGETSVAETQRSFPVFPAPWRLGGFRLHRISARQVALNSPPRPKDLVRSIDLVVGADGFKDNGRLALVFRLAKHDAKVVTTAGRPRTRQCAFEFVGAQRRGKRVGLQTLQERLQVVRRRGVFFEKASGSADERGRGDEAMLHALT